MMLLIVYSLTESICLQYFANDKGEAINSVKQVNVGDDVMLTVKDGQIKAKTYDITEGVYNGK